MVRIVCYSSLFIPLYAHNFSCGISIKSNFCNGVTFYVYWLLTTVPWMAPRVRFICILDFPRYNDNVLAKNNAMDMQDYGEIFVFSTIRCSSIWVVQINTTGFQFIENIINVFFSYVNIIKQRNSQKVVSIIS